MFPIGTISCGNPLPGPARQKYPPLRSVQLLVLENKKLASLTAKAAAEIILLISSIPSEYILITLHPLYVSYASLAPVLIIVK